MIRLVLSAIVICAISGCADEAPQHVTGSCPDGGVAGPLGICLDCGASSCRTTADCTRGETCVPSQPGCNTCVIVEPGPCEIPRPPDGPVGCSSRGDCCGTPCRAVEDGPQCGGACRSTLDECGIDLPCEEGFNCVQQPARPCSCDGRSFLACVPRCTAGSCEPGFKCGTSGACEPLRCLDAVFACGAFERCDPSKALADVHGCVRVNCESNLGCAGGFCVNGLCSSAPGTCDGPPRP